VRIKTNFAAIKSTEFKDYLVRFAFGGAVTALAGIIAKHYGPVVGGLFLAAPAIFPAAATLLEKHEEKRARAEAHKDLFAHQVAGVDAGGAALGSIGLMAFAFAAWKLLPTHSVLMTITSAAAAWLIVSLGMWYARKTLWRQLRARCKRGSAQAHRSLPPETRSTVRR
jgi:Protein of unknown function (DUF3147)